MSRNIRCNAACKNRGRLKKKTGLTIEQVKDINRRMPGKRKAQRAKKEMVEANPASGYLSLRNTPTVACNS